ncbi:MAG TPA: hypothetical protein ENH52_17425 [Nitrospirae bacterium]|nr:hypothetical protein [Nitrospirota bacterium]
MKNKYLFTVSNLGFMHTLRLLTRRFLSQNHYFILKRRLVSLNNEERLRSNFVIKKMDNNDLEDIIEKIKMLDPVDRQEVISRILFYNTGFRNCYIAKTQNGEIAYMQWLIYPSENSIIKEHYRNIFYLLNKSEVMIENSFTFAKFRGHGLMPFVTSKLLRIAKEEGYKFATGYIRKDRIIPLNEFIKMGFKITKMIKEYRFMGITRRML